VSKNQFFYFEVAILWWRVTYADYLQ